MLLVPKNTAHVDMLPWIQDQELLLAKCCLAFVRSMQSTEMRRKERAAFKIDPEFSYAEKGCTLSPPPGMARDALLVLDIQLVNWYSKKSVKAIGEDGVVLRTTKASESWEHPLPPFEVNFLSLSNTQNSIHQRVSQLLSIRLAK